MQGKGANLTLNQVTDIGEVQLAIAPPSSRGLPVNAFSINIWLTRREMHRSPYRVKAGSRWFQDRIACDRCGPAVPP